MSLGTVIWVRLGDTRYKIYDRAAFEREMFGNEIGLLWCLSTARTFQIVNELLKAAGSPERAYALSGGNDLQLFFLTPELVRMITTHPDADSENLLYTPTEDDLEKFRG